MEEVFSFLRLRRCNSPRGVTAADLRLPRHPLSSSGIRLTPPACRDPQPRNALFPGCVSSPAPPLTRRRTLPSVSIQPGLRRKDLSRSEEHTSELQSQIHT